MTLVPHTLVPAMVKLTRHEEVAQHAPESPASDASRWILIVDDDPGLLRSLAEFIELSGNGFKLFIRAVRCAEEALGSMNAQRFDLIISDYHMGTMDGVDFLVHARRLEPGVPCILMSADPTLAEERLRSSTVENVAFLPKPFDPAFLQRLVHHALGWSGVQT